MWYPPNPFTTVTYLTNSGLPLILTPSVLSCISTSLFTYFNPFSTVTYVKICDCIEEVKIQDSIEGVKIRDGSEGVNINPGGAQTLSYSLIINDASESRFNPFATITYFNPFNAVLYFNLNTVAYFNISNSTERVEIRK